MGNLGCDKELCFYNSSNKCTNIAVSLTVKCGLYLNVNERKNWNPTKLSKPYSSSGQDLESGKKSKKIADTGLKSVPAI